MSRHVAMRFRGLLFVGEQRQISEDDGLAMLGYADGDDVVSRCPGSLWCRAAIDRGTCYFANRHIRVLYAYVEAVESIVYTDGLAGPFDGPDQKSPSESCSLHVVPAAQSRPSDGAREMLYMCRATFVCNEYSSNPWIPPIALEKRMSDITALFTCDDFPGLLSIIAKWEGREEEEGTAARAAAFSGPSTPWAPERNHRYGPGFRTAVRMLLWCRRFGVGSGFYGMPTDCLYNIIAQMQMFPSFSVEGRDAPNAPDAKKRRIG